MTMEALANIYHALSEVTRLRILKLLEHGELCVCDLVAALEMSQPKISFHVAALKGAGLINDRKDGRWIRYSIVSECDLFRRYLISTTLEKITEDDIAGDRARLSAFLEKKESTLPVRRNVS
ncbi:MAG: metalloregulator ArsR/SmtB family transcription factor [Nitrospiraceae bacterium]|jgi:ArsR family transcriptional regulator|nr:metalloregulator ArsR/SmtB family transcription factor [Nitrospiraceae bacterium]